MHAKTNNILQTLDGVENNVLKKLYNYKLSTARERRELAEEVR